MRKSVDNYNDWGTLCPGKAHCAAERLSARLLRTIANWETQVTENPSRLGYIPGKPVVAKWIFCKRSS